jgi:superfamily II DNA or RNA helicase
MSALDLFSLPPAPVPAPAPPSRIIGRGMRLRYSQREDVDALMYALGQGFTKPCCVGATGIGKGLIIAELVGRLRHERGGKVVCLVDRAHLVHQLADEIERHLGIVCGRVADGVKDGINRAVVCTTVQALYDCGSGDIPLYELPQFRDTKSVIGDECHKLLAPVYRSPAQHFIEQHDAVVIGFTATPVASNGQAWRDYWDWTAQAEGPCMRTAPWCIKHGYLVPPRQAFVHVNLDLKPLYERLADTLPGEDSDDEERDDAAAVLLDLLNDKGEQDAARFAAGVADVIGEHRAVVFAPPRVAAAKLLASWLQATGRVTCKPVWGSLVDKGEVLKFARLWGSPQVLVNAALLTEGWNDPDVSAVFMCRLIKNWRLVTQMVGRVLRPADAVADELSRLDGPENADTRRAVIANSAKPDALVADLVGIDGAVLQASAVDVLYADESPEHRREMGEIIRQRKPHEGERPSDELLELARSQVLTRQHEQLRAQARRRAMAGELGADVTVTYERGGAPLPSLPTPREQATDGEKARFVAYATQYDVERAMSIADRFPRNQLRGMTWAAQRKAEKDGARPDWRRARQCYPEWASQRRRA